ncbi:MAG: hypothetical protein BZY88_16235 [SAR202 cluster bacterium Io17-Chloro-G9]|nr:MAG: hypothetical protein BZY88_16235 [SAR202 cluster bacterium Io17-Chloro-G9]
MERSYDRDQFGELVKQADAAIIEANFRFPPEIFAPDSRFRWIQTTAAGVDRVLTPELIAAEQVMITSSKGPYGALMAEHAVMLMLALARNLRVYMDNQAGRFWSRQDYEFPFMSQMQNKTIAILGVGSLGGNLARICKVGFGMKVLGMTRTSGDNPHIDSYFHQSDLNATLAEADVVALCLPRTPDTEKIIGATALAAMKPTAYLINLARGNLVDEEALIVALKSDSIAGAGLDTTTVEPLPKESPLWSLPNVIITPHVSPGTDQVGNDLVDFWCENIRRFAENDPLNGIVDRHSEY